MIEIQCTSCNTRYRIDERVLPDDTPTFKCSRCGHVFNAEALPPRQKKPARAAVRSISRRAEQRAEPPAEADPEPAAEPNEAVEAEPAAISQPASDPPPAAEPEPAKSSTEELFNRSFDQARADDGEGENLSFDFSDEGEAVSRSEPEAEEMRTDEHEPEWQVGESEEEPPPPPSAHREEPAYVQPRRPEPRFRMDDYPPDPPPEPERDLSAGARQFVAGAATIARSLGQDRGGMPDEVAYVSSRTRTHRSGLFLLTFFAVAVFYAAASTIICGTPIASARTLSQLPVIGSYFARPIVPAMLVALRGVNSTYQEIKSGEPALVITGTAENVGSAPLHAILLSVNLLDTKHRPVAAQAAYVGNGLSPKMIGEMTPREITFLQRLDPQKSFVVQPSASVPFAVVFLKPPPDVAHLRIEVSKAAPAAAAATPRT